MSTTDNLTPERIVPTPGGLSIHWADGAESRYPWFWLRDHGHDPDTLHPVTQQRQLYTAAVAEDIVGEEVRREDDAVVVHWNSGGRSRFPLAFLWRWRQPDYPVDNAFEPLLWDAATIQQDNPTVDYEAVMVGDAGVATWLDKVAVYGFCRVLGVPATPEATQALAERVGYIRETLFGGFWDFTADLAKADTAYTTLELRPHTDSTYSHDAPGLQLFHCLAFDGTGGESVLVDGFRIAEELRRNDPDAFATLSRVQVPGQYIGDGVWLRAERPVFRHDDDGRLVQVSFNNYDRAPFRLPDTEMTEFYRSLRAFESLANDPQLQWRHPLRPGEVLLFDNWRTLHGRAAYEGTRRLAGCYLNREDFDSRRRMLTGTHSVSP